MMSVLDMTVFSSVFSTNRMMSLTFLPADSSLKFSIRSSPTSTRARSPMFGWTTCAKMFFNKILPTTKFNLLPASFSFSFSSGAGSEGVFAALPLFFFKPFRQPVSCFRESSAFASGAALVVGTSAFASSFLGPSIYSRSTPMLLGALLAPSSKDRDTPLMMISRIRMSFPSERIMRQRSSFTATTSMLRRQSVCHDRPGGFCTVRPRMIMSPRQRLSTAA
mmetsp:Transcript_33105/g.64184  ORF Transcript_33105/g.64184 Transcript_33105/m.64184 type:complete len:221 (+) Transcript_33105:197-859(+)